MNSQIIMMDHDLSGHHNARDSAQRLAASKTYKDLSTICIVPTRGHIHAKVVQSWMGMMTPMNQNFQRVFMIGMEVGAAYSSAIEAILANPVLSKFRFILTLEEDNMPPPDGLLKLCESIHHGYDAVGALYWTKGEAGQPMIYGDPAVMPKNFIPQMPKENSLMPCNGLGMGFTLFRMDMFKDQRLRKPWFQTMQKWDPYGGGAAYTQDLFFFEDASKFGYKFACDTRVKVGHYDAQNDYIW
jgi:hypothetical protein